MRPATDKEIAGWDRLIVANPDGGNALQAKAFGETKGLHGWEPKYFVIDKFNLAVLILSKKIPGIGEFWYVPKGPGVIDGKQLRNFIKSVDTLENKPFVLRMDPEISKDSLSSADISKLGIRRATRDIQYNVSTVVVSLDKDDEALLARFKQKTRYNVRLALKKGVEVEAVPTNDETIDKMYELTQIMTSRAGVYLREKSYFADFWRLHSDSGVGQMFQAKYEGKVLAGAYITFVGKTALYKDGGSIRKNQEVQAPYALQFEIMRWLRDKGIEEYDLHGVPPANQINNPDHPLSGLARFKTGFNQEVTEYIGTFDLVLNQSAYRFWSRIGERLAMTYESRAKKRLFY